MPILQEQGRKCGPLASYLLIVQDTMAALFCHHSKGHSPFNAKEDLEKDLITGPLFTKARWIHEWLPKANMWVRYV